MSHVSKDLSSSPDFQAFDSAAIAAGINCQTSRPGYDPNADGYEAEAFSTNELRLPRLIYFTGGDLDLTLVDGTAVSLPSAAFAGKLLPIGPATVANTSTATNLLMIW